MRPPPQSNRLVCFVGPFSEQERASLRRALRCVEDVARFPAYPSTCIEPWISIKYEHSGTSAVSCTRLGANPRLNFHGATVADVIRKIGAWSAQKNA